MQEKILDICNSFAGSDIKHVSKRDTEEITQLIMPYCEYGTSLADRIGQAEQMLFSLTENQCRMLEFIYKHHYALIEGCAGSGKTVMAIKKAKELAQEGKSVLLLAYNQMIGNYLSTSVRNSKNIVACTYHKFCRDCLQKAGMLPEQMEGQEYWEKVLPEAFASLIQAKPMKYDAVIVDEGQDFRLEYWRTITELVKDDGYFYIFYDPDQNIYGTDMELPIKKRTVYAFG
jgi:superfamily I DNA and RNA helicase